MIELRVTRVKPGADLRRCIIEFVAAENITAGVVVSSVGSLSKAVFRLAGAQPDHQPMLERADEFEIVSLNGTVGSGGTHLHISLSDREGNVIGGHLKDGCITKTTVELAILVDTSSVFDRQMDTETGFDELVVSERS